MTSDHTTQDNVAMTEAAAQSNAPKAESTALDGIVNALIALPGAVALPLLVGRTLKLPPADVAALVNAALLMCGLATLLHALSPLAHVGSALPLLAGLGFATLGPLIAIAGDASFGDAGGRLQVMLGATIAAGAAVTVATPAWRTLQRVLPPVVRGVVLVVTGLVLLRAGIGMAADSAQPGGAAGAATLNLTLALTVLLAAVIVLRLGNGKAQQASLAIAIAAGGVLAWQLDAVRLAGVDGAPLVGFVKPLGMMTPRFELVPVIAVTLASLVVMVETAALVERVAPARVRPTLIADGLVSVVSGLAGSFPVAAGSDPEGRGTGPKTAYAAGGLVLVALAFSPKLGALIEALPPAVLAGAWLVLFGSVVAAGVKLLADVDYRSNRFNLYVVAISLGFGLIPMVAPQFFKVVLASSPTLAPLLHASVLLTGAAAILLNAYFNGRADAETQAQAADAQAG